MYFRLLNVLGAILLFSHFAISQDAEFSQFYANPLYLNPAFAGSETCPRLVINYRNQWPGLDRNFVTYNASYDQHINKLHGGIGVLANVDNAGEGVLKSTQASVIYAYRLRASENLFFNMALQGTFYQKSLDWDLLQFGDQIDPQQGFIIPTLETPPDYTTVIFPDFSAGFIFGWKGKMYGGIAVHHLAQPNVAFYVSDASRLPRKYTAHIGFNINLDKDKSGLEPTFYIAPNILYQQQGNFHQVNAGLYLIRLPIVLGTWFRHNFENADAFIMLIGIEYQNLKIGYSYDLTLSRLKSKTGGAHEISLAWQFNCIEKKLRPEPYNAPGF